MRRVAAMALLLPLLHLNVVRADVACGSHPTADARADVAADAMSDDGAHQHHAPAPEESCDVPAQSECCQALASCGPALGCLGASTTTADVSLTSAESMAPLDMPASAIAAPEPPPPKA